MPNIIFRILLVLAIAPPVLAVDFFDHRMVHERQARAWAMLGGTHTIVRTDDEILLVDWSARMGERTTILRDSMPEPPAGRPGLIAWGDSLVALAPDGQASHLVLALDAEGEIRISEIDQIDWLPLTAWIGGEPWFIETSPEDIVLTPALGGEGEPLIIDVRDWYEPPMVSCSGDRAVAVLPFSRLVICDLSDPRNPSWGPIIDARRSFIDVYVDGRTAYLGDNRFEAWNLDDIASPVLLGEVDNSNRHRMFSRGPGGLLACRTATSLKIYDVTDPADMRIVKSQRFEGLWTTMAVGTEEIIIPEGATVRRLYSFSPSTLLLYRGEAAWPTLDRYGSPIVATDGRYAWVQNDGRLLVDFLRNSMWPVTTPPLPPADDGDPHYRHLVHHRGHLIHASGNGRIAIENVEDPEHATLVAEIAPQQFVKSVRLRGDRLALRTEHWVQVWDLEDPSSPSLLGEREFAGSDLWRIALLDDAVAAITYGAAAQRDTVHIMAVDGSGSLPFLSRAEDPGHWDQHLRDITAMGRDLLALYSSYGGGNCYFSKLDLHQPVLPGDLTPHTSRFCSVVPGQIDVDDDPHLYGVQGDGDGWRLVLSPYSGRPEIAYPPAASVQLPKGMGVYATGKETIVLLGEGSIARYRLGDYDATPSTPPAPGIVHAVPNPANPRTDLVFHMDIAGPAEVAVFDLRGRRIRRWTQDLPAGPAALPWSGRDDRGRTVAAGTYLVRISKPDGTARGRCTIIR